MDAGTDKKPGDITTLTAVGGWIGMKQGPVCGPAGTGLIRGGTAARQENPGQLALLAVASPGDPGAGCVPR